MRDDRQIPQLLSSGVLVAALVLLRSTFAPFATQGCIMCPLVYIIPSRSVFQGLDGWIVLDGVIGLTLSATFLLMNVRRATAAIATLTLALSVLALGIFERVDAGGRIIGWDAVSPPVQLGPHGPIVSVPAHELSPPVYLDYGSYLFLGAAVVAVIAAAIIVVMNVRTHRDNRAPRRPTLRIPVKIEGCSIRWCASPWMTSAAALPSRRIVHGSLRSTNGDCSRVTMRPFQPAQVTPIRWRPGPGMEGDRRRLLPGIP